MMTLLVSPDSQRIGSFLLVEFAVDAVQWRGCISSVHFEQVKAYLYLA